MGLKSSEIIFDNSEGIYVAGENVKGLVKFTFDSPKKIRGIIANFFSETNTFWSDTRKVAVDDNGMDQKDELENFTGHEAHEVIKYYILGEKKGEALELPAGSHTYEFTYALPPDIVPSFEGEWGHIRYFLKLTLDRPWKFNQDTKKAFTVITPLDLNQNQRVNKPFKLELKKQICWLFFCRTEPIYTTISLPYTGYVSGQTIPIIIDCNNGSNVVVKSIKMSLVQVLRYHVRNPRADKKTINLKIVNISVGPVGERDSGSWKEQIKIPSLPPSNLANCGIIDLNYEIIVELHLTGAHKTIKGKIPIMLGTIPLTNK